jgi:hypothetical protein
MDRPGETLYWTLSHGQRGQLAERFGVCNPADWQMGEVPAAKLWLKRLRDCGSLGPALGRARQLHLAELRQLEDTLRTPGSQAWRQALEEWRDRHYMLLSLTAAGD